MNALLPVVEAAWAERMGWTLLHSVWQVATVAAVYAALSFALRRGSASLRYMLGCLALVAMIGIPIATWVGMSKPESAAKRPPILPIPVKVDEGQAVLGAMPTETPLLSAHRNAPQSKELAPSGIQLPLGELVADQLAVSRARLESILPWVARGWLIGVLLLALRPLWGLWVVRRLKMRGHTPLSIELHEGTTRLLHRLHIVKAVRFAESALVEVPTVVGYLRPIVLLPASAVTGLSTAQLELILAHELAHVRRHDYLVNLAQTAIEALLFYHPGMWWVSAQIRRERENCCDDVATSVCGSRRDYIRALYALESQRQSAVPAMAATGGSLVARVRRLASAQQTTTRLERTKPWLAGLIVLTMVGLIVTLGQSYADETPSASDGLSETEATRILTQPSAADATSAATLSGRILYDGEPPEPKPIRFPARDKQRDNGRTTIWTDADHYRDMGLVDESLIVGEDGGLANVVVWARSDDIPTPPWNGPLPPSTMRVLDGRFDPHVLVFWNAAPLSIANESKHGINFNRQGKFNVHNRVLRPGETIDIKLRRPERLPERLTSNIHPWLQAYILPLAHPYFAVTGRDGHFEIKNLPLGEWEFAMWHERAGWLATDRFPDGRFKLKIEPEQSDLGDLRVDPQTVSEREQPAGGEQGTAPQTAEQPAEDVTSTVDNLPPLPTLAEVSDKTLLLRQIEKALDEVERRGEGHVIVGRVLVEGEDDPTLVTAQMEVLGGGYFAGATRDLERPVGFAMHGYEPYLLQLSGQKGAIVDVGTIQLKRLPPARLLPVVGRVELEDSDELSGVTVTFSISGGTVNTPSNGTSPRLRWPEPIEVELDSGGHFYQTGFSPAEYTVNITAPGYLKQHRRIKFSDAAILNLGTIRLERPRRIEIDYILTRDQPFQLEDVKQLVLPGGSRWQITPHRYRYDIEFKQANGRLKFAWSYGPIFLADLGEGELGDYLKMGGAAAQHPPNHVALVDGHVYLLRRPDWEHGGEDLVLFKLRTNGGVPPVPAVAPTPDRPAVARHAEPATLVDRRPTTPRHERPAVDRLDDEGFSQLHRAAAGGHVGRVRELLEAGATVDPQQGTYRGRPLQYAASGGHAETVQLLIDHGANVDSQDKYRRTPLSWAAMKGHVDVIRHLLDAGANIEAMNEGGWTPLHYAVDKGHTEVAQLLIDRGADIHAKNSQGKTPVDLNPALDLRIPWRALRRQGEADE